MQQHIFCLQAIHSSDEFIYWMHLDNKYFFLFSQKPVSHKNTVKQMNMCLLELNNNINKFDKYLDSMHKIFFC